MNSILNFRTMDSPKISRQKQKSSVILFHSGLVFLTLFNWLRSPPIVKPRIFTKTSDGSLSSWCISLPTIFCYKSFFLRIFWDFLKNEKVLYKTDRSLLCNHALESQDWARQPDFTSPWSPETTKKFSPNLFISLNFIVWGIFIDAQLF